jgi:serine/threonine-protein kinase RsbW
MTDDRASQHELFVPSDLAEVRRVQDLVESALQANRFGETDQFAVKLAVEEALVNAIKHGNQLDPAKRVRILYSVDEETFHIRITDEGSGFNPEDLPDPTADDFLERPCGRGVLLIKSFMTTVDFPGRGNEVVMSKLKTPPDAE